MYFLELVHIFRVLSIERLSVSENSESIYGAAYQASHWQNLFRGSGADIRTIVLNLIVDDLNPRPYQSLICSLLTLPDMLIPRQYMTSEHHLYLTMVCFISKLRIFVYM